MVMIRTALPHFLGTRLNLLLRFQIDRGSVSVILDARRLCDLANAKLGSD